MEKVCFKSVFPPLDSDILDKIFLHKLFKAHSTHVENPLAIGQIKIQLFSIYVKHHVGGKLTLEDSSVLWGCGSSEGTRNLVQLEGKVSGAEYSGVMTTAKKKKREKNRFRGYRRLDAGGEVHLS